MIGEALFDVFSDGGTATGAIAWMPPMTDLLKISDEEEVRADG